MADEQNKPRNEIRIPLPDLDSVANKLEGWSEKTRQFENNPPRWFWTAVFIAIFAVVQFYLAATRHH